MVSAFVQVERESPMKRGLKLTPGQPVTARYSVERESPMKRGLKYL